MLAATEVLSNVEKRIQAEILSTDNATFGTPGGKDLQARLKADLNLTPSAKIARGMTISPKR